MNTNNRNYRNAFTVALLLSVVLLAVLGVWWWRSQKHAPRNQPSISQKQSPDSSQPAASPSPSSETEPTLAPIQLTPQRMQSIGVKLGSAQFKQVESELRVTGTVEADERRIACVQTRFPGWIQKVYAAATYQYVRKGQPLFTIYSPDLVPQRRNIYWPKRIPTPCKPAQ
jgi:Cu(I)/Ag(I) efflux system membrane fusion protein/cobalt-zinc-cadmium efflux system membrane fusion protein